MEDMKKYLIEGGKKVGVELSEDEIKELLLYKDLLIETNKHTNLTAIRDEKDLIEKHFIDSFLVQSLIDPDAKKAMDIGTGAGFPGMVLAILNKNIHFTLMDSVGKKIKFLEEVASRLNLSNVTLVNERAEEYIKGENQRETYDIGLCRGVSKLNVILEYMIPFLRKDGKFLALKMEGKEELEEGRVAMEILKTEYIDSKYDLLPYSGDKREILILKKVEETDIKYPRRTGIPLKRPLK